MSHKHIIVSKSVLGRVALLDPSVAAMLEQAGAAFDFELAEQDPSAAVEEAKRSLRELPKACDVCGTPLEFAVSDGRAMRFTAHTDEFCKAAARQRIQAIVSNLRREVLDHARVRRALGDALVEAQDAADAHNRAHDVLDRAGVPRDVPLGDETDALPARIRALVRRLVDLDAVVLKRIAAIGRMLGEEPTSTSIVAEFDRVEQLVKGRLQ